MADKPSDIAASVRQRLLNLAQKDGSDFQLLLIRYVLERLLYRLSQSPVRDQFVLKGAMLQAIWLENPFRHTRDLDLHARGAEDTGRVLATFRVVLGTEVQDDGVIFDSATLQAKPIRENVSYGGIRMTTTARLGSARIPVIVDVGFGDAITPRPDNVEYPSLLDLPKPRLMVYPRATVVAEKFEAMVSLGLTNSRMKDFHDVAVMACNFEFDGPELTKALAATFHRRKTVLPNKPPAAFTEAFTKRPETVALWRAFVERESIHEDYSDLDTVVGLLREFLLSPASAALGDADFPRRWLPRGPWSA